MNSRVKKIVARELVILFVAAIAGAGGFLYGYVSKKIHFRKLTEMTALNDSLDTEIVARITDFRKDPIVDSVYKIQMTFFDGYKKIQSKYASDSSNFFFWKNIISTVADSTFNFTYANDDAMNQIEGKYELRNILEWHRMKFYPSEDVYYKNKKLFSSFVQNVQLYNFVSHDKWTSYERLRIEQDRVNSDLPKLELAGYTSPSDVFFVVIGISSVLLFGVRYLFYLVRWVIATLKSS